MQEDVLSEGAIRCLLNLQLKGQSTKVGNVSMEQVGKVIPMNQLDATMVY